MKQNTDDADYDLISTLLRTGVQNLLEGLGATDTAKINEGHNAISAVVRKMKSADFDIQYLAVYDARRVIGGASTAPFVMMDRKDKKINALTARLAELENRTEIDVPATALAASTTKFTKTEMKTKFGPKARPLQALIAYVVKESGPHGLTKEEVSAKCSWVDKEKLDKRFFEAQRESRIFRVGDRFVHISFKGNHPEAFKVAETQRLERAYGFEK